MFKYLPKNPNSILSILRAGIRLYCASFIYTLALSLSVGLTALLVTYFFKIQSINLILVSLYSSFVTVIFIIPLVKRINCIGLGLPVKSGEAFHDFINSYPRMISLICVYMLVAIVANTFMLISTYTWYGYIITLLAIIVINGYIITHIYFADLFIILDNQSMKAAIERSSNVSIRDMWYIAAVVTVFFLLYLALRIFISPYFHGMLLDFNVMDFFAVIIGTPLFVCIQMVHFYQMKQSTAV